MIHVDENVIAINSTYLWNELLLLLLFTIIMTFLVESHYTTFILESLDMLPRLSCGCFIRIYVKIYQEVYI